MKTVTANEVKSLARRLSNAGTHLSACVSNTETFNQLRIVERTLEEARGVKSRSKQANADLAQAIIWGEKALEQGDSHARSRAVKAHLK